MKLPRARRNRAARLTGPAGLAGPCVLLLAGITACSPAAPAPASPSAPAAVPIGSSEQHISAGGLDRTFHVYRPASLAAGSAAPLVVMLHGGFGSGSQAEEAYGWDAGADAHGFVVAYPDGENRAWDVGGGCCGKPAVDQVDDVGFVTQVVTTLEHELPIDADRVYATGISNGGLLAYRLACDTDVFAAIGPDSATLLGDCPSPARTSVIHVHGTADGSIPYLGGPGGGVARIDGPAVPALVATWRAIDGCQPPTTSVVGTVTTSLAHCPGGRAVELVTIAGAGHQWPGAVPKPVLEHLLHLDPPSTAIDATDILWTFFAAHPRTP